MFAAEMPRQTSDVTSALASAIDDVNSVDPETLTDDELAEAVVELHRQQARLAAVAAKVAGVFDARRTWAEDGSRSCGAWVAYRCRLPLDQARSEVRLARRLRHMPLTAVALAVGDIAVAHARRLAPLSGGRTASAFAEHEDFLVGEARRLGWADFCRVVEYWRQAADPDGLEPDARRDHDQRRLHLSEGLRGTGILDGYLTPLARETVATALGRIEQELFEADLAQAQAEHGAGACLTDIARTPAQRRHDALLEMAKRAMTAPPDGKRPLPLVSVLVGYETFAGRVCELASGVVVTPGTVASLLDEALIERVVYDGPSRITDIGQARTFTGAARRALDVRDRHCTHVGCDVPAERCQGDHIDPYSQGGPTTIDNGQLRCGYHNRWRHQHPDHDPPPPDGDNPAKTQEPLADLDALRAKIRARVLAEQL